MELNTSATSHQTAYVPDMQRRLSLDEYQHFKATGKYPDWYIEREQFLKQQKLNTSCPAYPKTPSTYGPEFNQALDGDRLQTQLDVIAGVMLRAYQCQRWLSLAEIEEMTGYPSASISAQLRHLRKKKFGGHTVEKRRRAAAKDGCGGTYEYFVVPNPNGGVQQ